MIKMFKGFFSNKIDSNKKSRLVSSNNSLIDTLFSADASLITQTLSDEQMDKILRDLSVSQADESRKSVTEKKELQIVCKNDKHRLALEDIVSPDVISQILDTYMYGFNVFEINWKLKDGLYLPELVQRDYRNFVYDKDGVLKFKNQGYMEDIADYKIITATYRKRFNKPYGDGTIAKIYFPVKLKNASMEFWVRFLEKFGSPWAIGKTDSDADELANEINAMLSGDTAVIDPEEKIELVHPTANKGDFDKLIDYCDSQINRAILGGNLTGNVSSGSLAATQVHNEIREDLANADRKILEHVLNRAIGYFKEVNGITDEIYAMLKDEDDPRTELATRDKTIYEMGYRPTKEYIEATYNITVEEVQQQETVTANKTPFKAHLIANKTDTDEQKAAARAILFDELVSSFLENASLSKSNFIELLDKSESFEDLLDALDSLENVDQKTIEQAILISELYGMSKDD
jgi:phage gp29-like protein